MLDIVQYCPISRFKGVSWLFYWIEYSQLGTVSKKKIMEFSIKLAGWVLNALVFQ